METIKVRRANVILTVPDFQKKEYLAKGFDVIAKDGKILEEATMTNDISTLQKKLKEAQDKIKHLEAEIVRLNQELDDMAALEDTSSVVEQEGLVDPEPSVPKKSTKKTTTKKKSSK